LYSDPEQSFIREIVSNAWDSHVEAGTTDTPVIIKFNTQNYNKSITIRDYGTGLSPERFAEVYCNIGSSTKRDSNDFIGGFGIGKYSSLACSNTVYITSYYNNIAYYYVMIKSGNSITTNLLKELKS
jgi:HSP90 family molecular chaperone